MTRLNRFLLTSLVLSLTGLCLPACKDKKLIRYHLVYTIPMVTYQRTDTTTFYSENDEAAYLYGLFQRDGYDSVSGAKLNGPAFNYHTLDSNFQDLDKKLSPSTKRELAIEANKLIEPGKKKSRERGLLPLIDSSLLYD